LNSHCSSGCITIERKWHKGHELRLVPGSQECDDRLTNLILKCLQEDFQYTGCKIIPSYPESPEEDTFRAKSKKSLVIGQFGNGEVRLEIGEMTFSEFQRDAVFYITHPYNHAKGIDLETTIKQIRLFGTTLIEEESGTKQLSLVLPVGPYDLNHSYKRKRREGLIEGKSLKMFLEDVARAGYNEIIAICSHSQTTGEIARGLGMSFRNINPFRAEYDIPCGKLGPFLYKRAQNKEKKENYKEQMSRLTPFITYLKKEFGDNTIYFIATDDGSEPTIEQIAYAYQGDKQHILALIKDRIGPSESDIKGIKSSSTAEIQDIKGQTCIIADDIRTSGNTLNDIACQLKQKYGAGNIVALIARDIGYDQKIAEHTSIDRFVFLETNPNSAIANLKDARITRLPMETTALLLACEIYESYGNLRDRGEIKVR
jgi:phosphoribosylpyrophosphate synthetase